MAKVIDVDTESLICLSKQDGKADGSPALGKGRDFFEEDDEEELW